MIRSMNIKLWLVSVGFLLAMSSNLCAQITEHTVLSTYVDPSSISGEDLSLVLSQLASQVNVPIRLLSKPFSPQSEDNERLKENEKEQPKKTIRKGSIHGGDLKNVLNQIVTIFPGFMWRVNGQIIEVLPDIGVDPKIESLLETRIPQLTIEARLSNKNVGRYICENITVEKKLRFLGLTDVHVYDSINGLDYDLRGSSIAYSFDNKTVREILDEIVFRSNYKYWTIIRWGKKGEFLTFIVS